MPPCRTPQSAPIYEEMDARFYELLEGRVEKRVEEALGSECRKLGLHHRAACQPTVVTPRRSRVCVVLRLLLPRCEHSVPALLLIRLLLLLTTADARAAGSFVTRPDNKVSRLLKSLLREMPKVRQGRGNFS